MDRPPQLGIVLDKMYIDIASRVNDRTIGTFSTNNQVIIGDTWFFSTFQKRQVAQRQVYDVTSTAAITHGIDFTQLDRFTSCYGNYTDGTNWYGIINGSSVAIAGQLSFYVTPTQIVFVVGAGSPVLTRGQIVLQWITV